MIYLCNSRRYRPQCFPDGIPSNVVDLLPKADVGTRWQLGSILNSLRNRSAVRKTCIDAKDFELPPRARDRALQVSNCQSQPYLRNELTVIVRDYYVQYMQQRKIADSYKHSYAVG